MGSGFRNDSYNPLCILYNLRKSYTSPSIDSRKLQLTTGTYECYQVTNGRTQLGTFPGRCSLTWTCNATNEHVSPTLNDTRTHKTPSLTVTSDTSSPTHSVIPVCQHIVHATERVADMFWMCGTGVFSRLPANWTGTCACVLLSHPVVLGFQPPPHRWSTPEKTV